MKSYFAYIIVSFLCISQISFSQSNKLTETSEVLAAAHAELEQSLTSGDFAEWSGKHGISGTYIFDLTLERKGKIASVAIVNREGGSIAFQNKLKDFIKDYRFSFKMPKGKYYKFRYTFSF